MDTPTHLYRHFDANGTLLYVGISLSAFHRLGQHKNNAHWFKSIANMTIETFPSREKALNAERRAIRNEYPLHNNLLRAAYVPLVEAAPKPPKPVVLRRTARLTVKYIESLQRKVNSGEKVKEFHGDGDGLYLRVLPSGRMHYEFRKRPFKPLNLGHADIGLKHARQLANEAKVKQARGIDPALEKNESAEQGVA